MAIKNSYNFRKVNDQVTTSGVVGAKRLLGLADEGYELVINLLPDSSEYAVPDEREIVQGQGLDYVYIPVDFHAPSAEDFARFCQALDEAQSRKLHIHCAANYRVSAFYALYALHKGLWSLNDAEGFIDDFWDPADFPEWAAFVAEMKAKTND